MAADDLKINIRVLRYERQRLSDLVLTPLQQIKEFVARNLRSKEVAAAVGFLHNVIRADTLKTITDGEALIAVLNLYYGRDNLQVLKRLLNKIGCRDLVQVLNEWESNNNPVDTELFRECGYFALWLRIKCHLSWFSENRKIIFKSIKTLFGIPEIDPQDPELETLVFMGLSFGKTDVLIYVLVPLCVRRSVRHSVEDRAVVLALEQLHIVDLYFGQRSIRDKQYENHLFTSFNSISEARQGSDAGQLPTGKNVQQQLSNERVHQNGTENNYNYSAKAGFKQVIDPKHNGTNESIQVVQTSVGYIDEALPMPEPRHVQTGADAVRVVHPKIAYINSGDQSNKITNLQQSKKTTHPNVFNLKVERTVNEKVLNVQNQKFEKQSVDVEEESLARDEVEGVVEQGVQSVCETDPECSANTDIHGSKFTTSDLNEYWQDSQGNVINRRKTSVLDFSKDDSAIRDETETHDQPQILFNDQPSRVTRGVGLEDENKHFPQGKLKAIHVEGTASKYIGNGRYASTVTLQVNTHKKSTEQPHRTKPVEYGSTDHFTDIEASLVMGQPNFVDSEVNFQSKEAINSNAENSFSRWYENAMVDDHYKEMKPEPEPGSLNRQHIDEAFRRVSVPEERRATPNRTVRPLNYHGQTPIFSPPDDFRDVTLAANQLVKVKSTRLEEHPRHRPSVVSINGDSLEQRQQESPRETTVLKNRGASQLYEDKAQSRGHFPIVHGQHKSNRVAVVQGHPRQSLAVAKPDSELYSDYEDSVFGESESHDMGTDRFTVLPPPYVPPPEYNAVNKKSRLISSDESTSTDTYSYKSPLLSAASISSIYKEKEMFLSRDELQLSIRDAESKEAEKKLELCKELLTAAKTGDEEEIKRTLEEGADVNYQNEFGHTAVMIASREGYLDVVESLIGAGADVDLQEGFGKSALHEAAWSGQHKVVHRLISAGANTNITDEEHRTPLHYAAMRGKRRITEVLLLFGADVSLLTKNGQSAVELAYCYRHDDIVNLLMSSRDKKTRKEMEAQIRKQKLRQISSAASLPNLSKASSMKELSRSRSRTDLRKKKSVCVIQ